MPDGAIKVSRRGLGGVAQSAGCLPSIPETLGSLSSTLNRPDGTYLYSQYPRGGSQEIRNLDHPLLHREFEASLGYM